MGISYIKFLEKDFEIDILIDFADSQCYIDKLLYIFFYLSAEKYLF